MKADFNQEIESNLRKIAECIKENYTDSCIAYNDRESNMSGQQLLKEVADFFTYKLIGLCGCGRPEDTIIAIRDYLQIVNDKRNDKRETIKNKFLEKFGVETVYDNSLLQFMAYMLDDKGLTEHGTSIGGNWITDLGKMCLYVYKLLDIEEESEETINE